MPVILAGFAACVSAADAPDRGLELRRRLDSIDVETQVRKRQGKPIEDLEAAAAELRDTLVGLRGSAPQAAPRLDVEEEPSYFSNMPFVGELLSFRPNGAFDWVIVGTGAVALLSGLALLVGIFAGGKKKRAVPQKKQQSSRKINLAPTSTNQRALPEADRDEPPPRDSVAEFQSLVENLRKVAPPPVPPLPKIPPPFALSEPEPRVRPPAPTPAEPEPRKPAPPPPAPLPPPEPPPLILNASESPQAETPPLAGLKGKPLAPEVLSARTPPAPPPEPPNGSPPKAPPQAGGGFPAFNDLVVVAAKDGLDELEISRRYQLSIDQVRLILRMEYNKTKSKRV